LRPATHNSGTYTPEPHSHHHIRIHRAALMIFDHLLPGASEDESAESPLQAKGKRKRTSRQLAQRPPTPRRVTRVRQVASAEKTRRKSGIASASAVLGSNASLTPTKKRKREVEVDAQAKPPRPVSRRDVDEVQMPREATAATTMTTITNATERPRRLAGRPKKMAKSSSLAQWELIFHSRADAKLFDVCHELNSVLENLDSTLSIPALFLELPSRRTSTTRTATQKTRVPLGTSRAGANTVRSMAQKYSFQAALDALNKGISAATASADALLLNCRALSSLEPPGITGRSTEQGIDKITQSQSDPALAVTNLKKKITGTTSTFFITDPFTKDPTPPGLAFSLQPSRYGLIQERIRESLWALVVQAILWNQTTAKAGRPVLFTLLSQYPTPQSMAVAKVDAVFEVIRVLGLGKIRSERLIKMAEAWVAAPPDPARRYGKKNYPREGDNLDVRDGELLGPDDERTGWEIAHLPGVGPYALDSYRIFYRDQLRGIEGAETASRLDASGNKKRGRPPKRDIVEAEWQRVVPEDKDLKPYVEWRWKEEGWLWDGETGKRTRIE
jgi:methyl-CpG-binding domain protein 4